MGGNPETDPYLCYLWAGHERLGVARTIDLVFDVLSPQGCPTWTDDAKAVYPRPVLGVDDLRYRPSHLARCEH